MDNFIEIHSTGIPHLINTNHIEEITTHGNGSCIYFAFTVPGGTEQDYLYTDETYEEVKQMILSSNEGRK